MSEDWINKVEGREERLDRFISFHRSNPKVWELFEKYALQAAQRGKGRYGARVIMERVRWDFTVDTAGDKFKINNNHIPHYARMFINVHPEHQSFFKTRNHH